MKKNIIIALTIIGVLLVATIGATFAYFVANSQNGGNDASLHQTTEELGSILLDGTKAFTSYDLLPGQIGIQEFTIEKDSESGRGIYELDLAATVPEEFRSDIEILLYKTTEPDTNNVTVNIADPTLENNQIYQSDSLNITGSPELVYQGTLTENPQIILEQADFDVTTLEKTTYYLVYHYKNNGNQDDQQGKTFTGTISVRLINEKLPTFADTILACNDTAANCIKDNASLSNEIVTDDPDNNARYIGANPSNYVEFGLYPEGTVKGKWEEIGMPVSSVEECNGMADTYEGNEEFLEEFQVSSIEEFKSTYCVQEDVSNQPILWRIIGAMNNIDDGTGTKEKRLKIIRDEPYSKGTAWDIDNVNDWTTASLQEELNTTYLSSITNSYQEMIDNAVWNLGGLDYFSDNYLTSKFYASERGIQVYSGQPTTWTGKVALMYPSDYGYATSGGSSIDRDTCLSYDLDSWDDYSDCYNNDWLYDNKNQQWTLTPTSSSVSDVFGVVNNGYVGLNFVDSPYFAVFPALYLSSNVKITGGDGSESNPFTLSL